MAQPYPPGGRLPARPDAAKPCPACGDLVGRGYPTCVTCADRVDTYWRADWAALLEGEGVTEGAPEERELATLVLADDLGAHPWTCLDWAMRLVTCPLCRTELGTGNPGCMSCANADQNRWAWDHAAVPKTMTRNEHALRLAVATLRAARHRRKSVVAFWHLSLPFVLAGATPTARQARRIRTHLLANRHEDLAEADSLTAMAILPDLPWRTPTP
ncbi:hypothetical protein [Actinokineospora iranica]|nr:hypothetical protein [Actinokineospora iranica]